MGTFEPYADKAGPFRFRPMARNGETILKSEGYTTADAGNRAAKDTQDMSKP